MIVIKYKGVTLKMEDGSKIPEGAEVLEGGPVRVPDPKFVEAPLAPPPPPPPPPPVVKPEPEPEPAREEVVAELTEDDLNEMTKRELLAMAEEKGLDLKPHARKSEIVGAILDMA